jgi:hypothetical protein
MGGVIVKKLFGALLLISPLLFLRCNMEDTPVSSKTSIQKTINIYAYGSSLDSAYYKMWSDSSWEKFNQVTSVNGKNYVTTLNSDGDEYYYDSIGYAGIKPNGQSLILFDAPLSSLPDTLVFGQKYIQETTFSYQGINYLLKDEQTLEDTVSVSVPFGTFNPCLWFQSTSTTTVAGQSIVSAGQFWLAIGPSNIQQTLNSGNTIMMVRGCVNSKSWGVPIASVHANLAKKQNSSFLNNLVKPMFRFLKIGSSQPSFTRLFKKNVSHRERAGAFLYFRETQK